MTDIYLGDFEPTRSKLRSYRVTIDNPFRETSFIHYHQEILEVTAAEEKKSSTKAETITAPFETDAALKVRLIHDPITGQDVPISGAAVAEWIRADYVERATQAAG